MAWESRNGKGRYYTRSRKVDGRVVREYLGCGEAAVATADLDSLDREQRERQRQMQRAQAAEQVALDSAVNAVCEAAQLWGAVALLAAGYRRHDRGEWRRRREQR